jgi:hypothetical protein
VEDSHDDFKPKVKSIDYNSATDAEVLAQIDTWVKNTKVVLFMKGEHLQPVCSYSNLAVQILKFYGTLSTITHFTCHSVADCILTCIVLYICSGDCLFYKCAVLMWANLCINTYVLNLLT